MKNKPICYVPERVIPEVYSGTPTFLGLPKISSREDLNNHDIVFMGVPWEGTCTWGGHSTCELATKTVRNASARYGGYLLDYDLDIFDYFSGGDYGDTCVQNGNQEKTWEGIREKYGDILDAGKFPVVFGGDHSISSPMIEAFARKYQGRIGVIHFDAHMDNVPTYGEDLYARCSPFYRVYEMMAVDPKNMVHIGVRGPRNHPDGLRLARENGATVITGMSIKLEGWKKAVEKALAVAGKDTDAIYVTVCSDVLDVANNPGGPPDACGLTSFELGMMLHECGKSKAEAFDYVEIYPANDPNNVSSHTAVWMTLHLLAGVTQRRFGL